MELDAIGVPVPRPRFLPHPKYSTALTNTARPSPVVSVSGRVQRGCWVRSMWRSGWGIRPNTRPVASQRPATLAIEPFGLSGNGRRPSASGDVASDSGR